MVDYKIKLGSIWDGFRTSKLKFNMFLPLGRCGDVARNLLTYK